MVSIWLSWFSWKECSGDWADQDQDQADKFDFCVKHVQNFCCLTQKHHWQLHASSLWSEQDNIIIWCHEKSQLKLMMWCDSNGLIVQKPVLWFMESLGRVFEWTWWMKGYINYVKLTDGKLITQMLVKMSLFVTNKVFSEIIAWLHVDLHILHTVREWQATVSTNMRMWKFCLP